MEYFSPDEVGNILVVSSTAIGDTLLSTPAIRALRKRYPGTRIIAHFNTKHMELFKNNPDIDGIIPYHGGYRNIFGTIREFRKYNFTLVLIFHGNEPQATPMAYLSGARFILKTTTPERYGFLLSNPDGFNSLPQMHAIERRLKITSLVDCDAKSLDMVLITDTEDDHFAEAFLKDCGFRSDQPIIGLQVGAANLYKMWPRRYFAELGRKILERYPEARIVLTGSKKEMDLCRSVAKDIGNDAVSAAGIISLGRTASLLKKMRLLVTNDTGTMHMAIALKTRTVSLFCPTRSGGTGPIQDLHLHSVIKKAVPCVKCVTKKCKRPFCMESITVNEVFEAVNKAMII